MIDQTRMETARRRIPPTTEIGWTALAVGDLPRSLQFYTQVLGFSILERDERSATLGAGAAPLLLLIEQPGARPKPPRATGLYHFAILVPSRLDLARSLLRLAEMRYPLAGASDHLVSEALYLDDPDGNGIEIYRDRPRDSWQWQGDVVKMASDPIDLAGLLAEAQSDGSPWQGLPAGTRIGHIHLQVADIERAEAFYHGILGFDIVARWHGALFVSAGGYHHHIGLNTWQSRNGPPAPADAAGLRAFTISVQDEAAQEQVARQLQAAAVSYTADERGIVVRDPWGNTVIVTPAANLAAAAASTVAEG